MYHRPACIRTRVFIYAVFILLLTPQLLKAQSSPTASRTGDLSVYGAYARVTPDYGPQKNNGAIFGVDYTRFLRWPVTPSLEFRGKVAPGPVVGERTFGGGIRVERRFRHFRPYADFLISSGVMTFTHPTINTKGELYASDNSIVYSAGLGVDYDVTRRWSGRFDYQFEHWSLGTNQTYTPEVMSIGVVYHIPFGGR